MKKLLVLSIVMAAAAFGLAVATPASAAPPQKLEGLKCTTFIAEPPLDSLVAVSDYELVRLLLDDGSVVDFFDVSAGDTLRGPEGTLIVQFSQCRGDNGARVLNYGNCVTRGIAEPSAGLIGPSTIILNKNRVRQNDPGSIWPVNSACEPE